MPRAYRTPTPEEAKQLEEARQMMQRGISEEQDFLTKLLPTAKASAAREQRRARRKFKEVPEAAREGEAYNQAGYAKGGSIDGCAQRGKTKGRVV